MEAEKQSLMDITQNAAGLLAMVGLLKIPQIHRTLPAIYVISTFRFYFFILMVEAGYRFHLCKFGIRAPVCFNQPWKSETISEFWGQRWNLAIAQQLRNIFFKPLAEAGHRRIGELSVFLASSCLHMIPIVSLEGSRKSVVSTALFFILQPLIISMEKQFQLKGPLWVHAAFWSTAPLFVLPLYEVI